MKYLILLFLILTSLFANNSKEILLLHSYNSGLKWSDGITQGIKEVFEKYPQFELTIEYMDSKKIDTKEYLETLTNLYEKKFSNRKYDAIITADNYAYKFALQNHKKLFNNSNIVFCGVENFVKNSIPKNSTSYIV